jgi:hypothetical protein
MVAGNVSFEAFVSGGQPPLEFRWLAPGLDELGNATRTLAFDDAGEHVVTLVVQDARGRVASDSRVVLALAPARPSPSAADPLVIGLAAMNLAVLALVVVLVALNSKIMSRLKSLLQGSPHGVIHIPSPTAPDNVPEQAADDETSPAAPSYLSERLHGAKGTGSNPTPEDEEARAPESSTTSPIQDKEDDNPTDQATRRESENLV